MASPSLSIAGFQQKVVVGIADMAVSNNANAMLATYSLGSCVGIAIYDPVSRVGGLLHAMLPDSTIDAEKAARKPMFVDTGIPALFRAAYELHAEKHRVHIYVVGGAQIMDNSGFFNIGKRNYEAVTAIFSRHGLRSVAEEVGGLVNRTMYLNLATGQLSLKISGQQEEVVLCKR
jgi:chemotaxis protein CheD